MSKHDLDGLDPRTLVVVGVGQVSENIDSPGYQGLSAVELAVNTAQAALADCVAGAATAAAIDTVAGVRQFEISTPGARPAGTFQQLPALVRRAP